MDTLTPATHVRIGFFTVKYANLLILYAMFFMHIDVSARHFPMQRINKVVGEGRATLDLSDTMMHADPDYGNPEEVDKIFAFLDRHLM